MAIEDPQEAVKVALLDRLTHPVMGVMVFAFALCNWKPVAFLIISDTPAECRIEAAEKYCTMASLLYWPVVLTLIWVVAGPILKALSLMYDRRVSNWEKVRAYKAALSVVERNKDEANAALQQVEADLSRSRAELAHCTEETVGKRAELLKLTAEFDSVSRVGSAGWQSAFIGGERLPLKPGTEAYAKAKSRFDLLEKFRTQVLGNEDNGQAVFPGR